MSNVAVGAGILSGVPAGLESARQRRYEETETKRRRQREDLQMEGAELSLSEARNTAERRPVLEGRSDTAYEQGQAEYQHALDRRPMLEERGDTEYAQGQTEYNQGQADYAHGLERQGINEERGDRAFDRGERDYVEQVRSEGLQELAINLDSGMDDKMSIDAFNRNGEWSIDPATFEREGDQIRFVDSDGDEFEGTIDELFQISGGRKETKEPIGVSRGESLVDPETFEEVYRNPYNQSGRGSGNGAGGDPRDISSYSPTTVRAAGNRIIERQFEGALDISGNWSVADPEDSQIISRAQGDFSDIENQYRDIFSLERPPVSTEQMAHKVVSLARKHLLTATEMNQLGEEAVPGFGGRGGDTREEWKENWITAHTAKVEAEYQAALSEVKEKLIGGITQSQAVELARPPYLGRDDLTGSIQDGKAIDGRTITEEGVFEAIVDGQRIHVQKWSDGKIYQVTGAEDDPMADAQGRQPEPVATVASTEPIAEASTDTPDNRFAEPTPMLSPWVTRAASATGEAVKSALTQEQIGAVVPQADRVKKAFSSSQKPDKRDIEALSSISDGGLEQLGLSADDIAKIRSLSEPVDRSLREAR